MAANEMVADRPRIFVNISSYRDTECQWTVKDMFEKALHPDRVFPGILWQFMPGEDDDCFQVETRPEQCRVKEINAKESKGVCWARHQTQKLWQGEEFTLQIDSHMRFAPEWDRLLLDMLAACPSSRSVLTTYPIPYEPPDRLSADAIVTIQPKYFDENRILMFRSRATSLKDAPERPQQTAFCAAGMLFAPSGIIEEVPYDPYIYFQGEEIALAVRLWTHGWEIFSPNRVVAYHDYTKRPGRVRHWSDQKEWRKLNALSVARVRHLLGIEESKDAGVLKEIARYGLGRQRTLAEYETFSGVDFKKQTLNGKLAKPPSKLKAASSPEHRRSIFTAIWEKNGWQCDETRSGHGSTLVRTRAIREQLPKVLDTLGVGILGDAGCGDFNWARFITGECRLYLGFDIVGGLIEDLRDRFADRTNHFFSALDIVTDTLPECDAILCRDCLTHLPFKEARRALRRIKASKSRYLIATTHPQGENTRINTGGWYPMNLTAPPFNLLPPDILIDEQLKNSSKALGVWPVSVLRG